MLPANTSSPQTAKNTPKPVPGLLAVVLRPKADDTSKTTPEITPSTICDQKLTQPVVLKVLAICRRGAGIDCDSDLSVIGIPIKTDWIWENLIEDTSSTAGSHRIRGTAVGLDRRSRAGIWVQLPTARIAIAVMERNRLMQSQSLISLWGQRFTCGTCAVALVGSLALYHKTVLTNPIVVAQTPPEGNAATNPKGIKTKPRPGAIPVGKTGVLKRVLLGSESHLSWQQLLETTKFNSSP